MGVISARVLHGFGYLPVTCPIWMKRVKNNAVSETGVGRVGRLNSGSVAGFAIAVLDMLFRSGGVN